MGRIKIASLFVVLLSLTSCANWSKTVSKVKIEKDMNLSEKADQALATHNFQKGFWPDEDWWTMFEDEQLSCFIKTGLSSNPSLKAAEARVKQANQEAFIVRSKLLPNLQGAFNYIYSYLSQKGMGKHFSGINPNFNLYMLMLDFTYEFDFWKKNRNMYEAALGAMQTQEAINQQTRMVLSISIANQYYDLQANLAKLVILEQILENKTKLLRLTELRRVNRISNTIDINNIKQEVLMLQEALTGVATELKLQKSLLTTLMGQNPGEEINISAKWDFPDRPFELPENIGLGLLSRRPDLMSQVWKVYSMTKNIGVAVAEFLPDLNLSGIGGTDAIKFSDLFTKNAGSITALPKLATPIFTGGRLTASLKSKLASYEAAVYDYNEMLLSAANEVVSGIIKINSNQEMLKYQEGEVASKRSNYDLIYSRYKHGIDSMITVLISDDTYLRSRYRQVDMSRKRVESSIKLVRALGGGYHYTKSLKAKETDKLQGYYGDK